jgi:hypothetical protein
MSENTSLHGTGQHRSVRDRIFDIFRTSSSNSFAAIPDANPRNLPTYTTDGPDARTRLLESYHDGEAVCGQKVCRHGTFSPSPEQQHGVLRWNAGRSDLSGDSNGSPSGVHPDNLRSLESSMSALPVKNRNRLYVLKPEGLCVLVLIIYLS